MKVKDSSLAFKLKPEMQGLDRFVLENVLGKRKCPHVFSTGYLRIETLFKQ